MTQDEIIEMARQAGFEDFDKWAEHYPQETKRWCERMEAFANLVVAKERRECAKLAAEVGYWGLVNEIEARGEQA